MAKKLIKFEDLFKSIEENHDFGTAVVSLYDELPLGFLDGCDPRDCQFILEKAIEYQKASVVRGVVGRLLAIAETDVYGVGRAYHLFAEHETAIRRCAGRSGLVGEVFLMLEQKFSVVDLHKLYMLLYDPRPTDRSRTLLTKVEEILCCKPAKSASIKVWRSIIKEDEARSIYSRLREAAKRNELELMIGPVRFANLVAPEGPR